MNDAPGIFITFEGGDGSGKTTQLTLLCDALHRAGIDYVRTREPGGTDNALAIRAMVLEGDKQRWDTTSELFLFLAARRDHVTQLIRPALAAGKWVICDRFTDSTLAYQGGNETLPAILLDDMCQLASDGLVPHTTFLLDIEPEQGLQRVQTRAEQKEMRFESKPLAYHQALRARYQALAQQNSARMVVVDAAQSKEMIQQQISQTVRQRHGVGL